MASVEQILKKVKQLAPIPPVAHKVLALAVDPECSLKEMVHLIEHDPAITANLMKMCNSVYFGLPIKVDSIQQAFTLMGLQRVIELVMALNLAGHLQRSQNGYGLAKGQLWQQSVATAMVARSLAERRDLYNLPAIYTAALLRDIGKVLLHEYVGRQLARIQELVKTTSMSFAEAEKQCIGMDHATLGGIIAKEWNFSDHMTYMIEHHHLDDPAARNDPATATIYQADMVAMVAGTGIGVDRLAYKVYEDVFDEYFLSKDELKALVLSYEGHLKGVQQLLSAN